MEIDNDYLRTGTVIGFRASRELCSNYSLLLGSHLPLSPDIYTTLQFMVEMFSNFSYFAVSHGKGAEKRCFLRFCLE